MASTVRRGRGAHHSSKNTSSLTSRGTQDMDDGLSSKLRLKYADKLATLKDLFKDWTDDDLLFALQDANGDLELAIDRISSDQATKWDSVPTKVQKATITTKSSVPSSDNVAPPNTRGSERGVSSRGGRGGLRGRGAPRGRGGAVRGGGAFDRGRPRKGARETSEHPTEGTAWNSTDKSKNAWGSTNEDGAVSSNVTNEAGGNAVKSDDTWGNVDSAAPITEETSKTEADSWNAAPAPPTQIPKASSAPKASSTVAPSNDVKPSLKTVQPGKSWAQIARPPSPAKASPKPKVVEKAKPEPVAEPVAESTKAAATEDPWAETPAAAGANTWTTSKPSSIVEGWANVLEKQESTGESTTAPQAGASAAGSLESSEPAPLATSEEQRPAAIPTAPSVNEIKKDQNRLMTPPGLAKRGGQRDAPVVMPSDRGLGLERTTVQFGSLSLFESENVPEPQATLRSNAATEANGTVNNTQQNAYENRTKLDSTQQQAQQPATAVGTSPRSFQEKPHQAQQQQPSDPSVADESQQPQQQQQQRLDSTGFGTRYPLMSGAQAQPGQQDAYVTPATTYGYQQQPVSIAAHQVAPHQVSQSPAPTSVGQSHSYTPFIQSQMPGFQGTDFTHAYNAAAVDNSLRSLEPTQNPHEAYLRQNQQYQNASARFGTHDEVNKNTQQIGQDQLSENQAGQQRVASQQPPHQQPMAPYAAHHAAAGFMPYYYGQPPAYNPAGYPSWPHHYNQTAIPPSYYGRGRLDTYPMPHQPSPQNVGNTAYRQNAPETAHQPPQPAIGQAAQSMPNTQIHHGHATQVQLQAAPRHSGQQNAQPPYAAYNPYGYGAAGYDQDGFNRQQPQQSNQQSGGHMKGDVGGWME